MPVKVLGADGTGVDTDVIKAYVEVGLGIAVVAKLAYDAARDTNLRAVDASHLFESNLIQLDAVSCVSRVGIVGFLVVLQGSVEVLKVFRFARLAIFASALWAAV